MGASRPATDAHSNTGQASFTVTVVPPEHGTLALVPALPPDGKYAAGWDQLRRDRFRRQQDSGLFPGIALTEDDPASFPTWDDLDAESRALYARHMEVYAAAVQGIDDSVGRLVAHLRELDEYDNTLFVFLSDNGATSEGGPTGTRSYFSQFALRGDLPADWERDVPRPLEEMGGPRVHGHYPAG